MQTQASRDYQHLRQQRKTIALRMNELTRGRFDLARRAEFQTLDLAQQELRRKMQAIQPDSPTDVQRARERAFSRYLRCGLRFDPDRGTPGLSMEDAELMRGLQFRDMGTGGSGAFPGASSSDGQFFVPLEFSGKVDAAMKFSSDLLLTSTIETTSSGAPLAWPDSDDTQTTGELVAESNQTSSQDIGNVGQVVLSAYKFSSKVVKVSAELVEDAWPNFENWLATQLAVRISRAATVAFTTGTGSNQPTGIVSAATVGLSQSTTPAIQGNDASGSPNPQTQVGYLDLVNLESSVDVEYRRRGSYMMHGNTLQYIKTIKDSSGRPLWAPGLTADAPDRVNGHEVFLNNAMAQLGAGNTTVLFGDLSRYTIRRTHYWLSRLATRFIDTRQVGFILWVRMDGNLMNAGNPVKALVQHT